MTFQLRPAVDWSLLILGAVGTFGISNIVSEFPPPACDPCDPTWVNSWDRTALRFDFGWARSISDQLQYVLIGLALFGSALQRRTRCWREIATDIIVTTQAIFLVSALHQVVRVATRRPRPFMYHRGRRLGARGKPTATMSFFSGHTAFAFVMTTSYAQLSTAHYRGHVYRLGIWTGGLLVAVAMGLMRVLGGDHFWTDIICGALVGSVMGLLVPAWHQQKTADY